VAISNCPMKNKFLSLIILLASFSLVACGSSNTGTTETIDPDVIADVDTDTGEEQPETQSTNGIWSNAVSGDDISTETIGFFNDGEFILVNIVDS
jgi:predicted small lipoprotein YifL